ncbi:MAG: TetR family transcriptional regulator [Hyphomicrobiales bacterium]|nr:MAG: TetR family transcriptional regulator [Hyphomicrobiales bacterium]
MNTQLKNNNNKRLGKEDWVLAAFTTLSESGVAAVRVVVLAKNMGVTKGSFYWHFENRQELLDAILKKWRLEQRVIDRVEAIGGTPKTMLKNLLASVPRSVRRNKSGATELAVRSWARNDEKAAEAVAMVDKERIIWTQQRLIDMGFSEDIAEMRAFTIYSYIMAQGVFSTEKIPNILERIHDNAVEMFLQK